MGLPTLTPGDQRDWSAAALCPQSMTYRRSAVFGCATAPGAATPMAASATSNGLTSLPTRMAILLPLWTSDGTTRRPGREQWRKRNVEPRGSLASARPVGGAARTPRRLARRSLHPRVEGVAQAVAE